MPGELRGPGRAQRFRYRHFVEKGLLREIENPFEAGRWQAVLGDESLVQRLWDRVKGLQKATPGNHLFAPGTAFGNERCIFIHNLYRPFARAVCFDSRSLISEEVDSGSSRF